MNLTADHELIRDSVRRLAEAELAPIAARIDAEDWFPRDFFLRLGEIGALGVLVPEEYGGSGGGYIGAAVVMEELAPGSRSLSPSVCAPPMVFGGALAPGCSARQKQRVPP